MANPAPLNEKYKAWLALMQTAHPRLKDAELARRIGVPAETFYRGDKRPGVFNADSLDNMEAALGIPAWLILQAIQAGRVIEVHREAEGTG